MIFDLSASIDSGRKYLYAGGDECTDVTGGWESKAWARQADMAAKKAPTVTKNEKYMLINQTSGNGYSGAAHILKDVDVTNYSTLKMSCTYVIETGQVWFGVIDRDATYFRTEAEAIGTIESDSTSSTRVIKSVDISEVSGSYDIFIGIQSWEGTNKLALYEMWLE